MTLLSLRHHWGRTFLDDVIVIVAPSLAVPPPAPRAVIISHASGSQAVAFALVAILASVGTCVFCMRASAARGKLGTLCGPHHIYKKQAQSPEAPLDPFGRESDLSVDLEQQDWTMTHAARSGDLPSSARSLSPSCISRSLAQATNALRNATAVLSLDTVDCQA